MSDEPDFESSTNLIPWRLKMRAKVKDYLAREGVFVSDVPLVPAYELPPYLSLWLSKPGVWAVAGDVPPDYFRLDEETPPREVLQHFADRWHRVAANMLAGQEDPEITIGNPDNVQAQQELGELLRRRAALLERIAKDDEHWEEG